MSLQKIKGELKPDIPILAQTNSVANILSILLNRDIIFIKDLDGNRDKFYNCQSLFFDTPQPCRYTLNLKTGTTAENKSANFLQIKTTQKMSVIPYMLNQNNYFPPIEKLYRVHFTDNRVGKEIEYKYYPQIVKKIHEWTKNPVILDGTPYQGCNIISICASDKNAIAIGCEFNDLYYNAMVMNWKLFGMKNSHQLIKKSYREVINEISNGKDLLFSPNVLYLESETIVSSSLDTVSQNLFDLVIIKLPEENALDYPDVPKIAVNDGQVLVFLDKSFRVNIFKPPEVKKDIEPVTEQEIPIDKIYSEEIRRRQLYNEIKKAVSEIIKPYRKLEGPKLLLRYVFSLIIKRTDADDPVFITSDFRYGDAMIIEDAKYFRLPDNVRDRLINLLHEQFIKASEAMKRFSKISGNFQKSTLSISEIIKLRYDYLELSTMGLAYPYAEHGYKRDDDVLECFSNPINRYFENFCTAFPDIEKYVGSRGSFWTMEDFPYQILVINPPFDQTLISEMFKKLDSIFSKIGGADPEGASSGSFRTYNIIQDVEIIIPYWSDMKEIQAFQKHTVYYPGFNYRTKVIPKNDIYFIDYTRDMKIHPCDIFLIEIYREGKIVPKPHKLLTSTIDSNSNEYYIFSFSPFRGRDIQKSKTLPNLSKNSRRLTINCKEPIQVVEILEKFLSNYGDAVTTLIYNPSQSEIILDVFTPHFDRFIEALAISGIAKYCKIGRVDSQGASSEGLKIELNGKEEYLDIKTGDNTLSKYKIKVVRSELTVFTPSKEMKLMEPMFLFN